MSSPSNKISLKLRSHVSTFFKKVVSVVSTVVKAKTLAMKSKATVCRAKYLLLKFLRTKQVLLTSAISHRIHAPLEDDDVFRNTANVAVLEYKEGSQVAQAISAFMEMENDEDGGEEEEEEEDFVRSFRKEAGEEYFNLEEEIDEVANVFIRRFHEQIMMQKQESFKRYQEMMERSV